MIGRMAPFVDRTAAGRELAQLLLRHRGRSDVLVLGLPRGGVPVAFEIARTLGVALDVLVVRKIGAPGQPEFALGAVASGGVTVWNADIAGMFAQRDGIEALAQRQRIEAERRERLWRGSRPSPSCRDRLVILVDDGAATGSTMIAAARAVRALGAREIVVALPVASRDAIAKLSAEADDVVCIHAPSSFMAVGEWYADFQQTTDAEVSALLAQAEGS
jgi:putative phosphoribosyl transferase